jgi:hypothetical protein
VIGVGAKHVHFDITVLWEKTNGIAGLGAIIFNAVDASKIMDPIRPQTDINRGTSFD